MKGLILSAMDKVPMVHWFLSLSGCIELGRSHLVADKADETIEGIKADLTEMNKRKRGGRERPYCICYDKLLLG